MTDRRKKHLHRSCVDPLTFLEYFVQSHQIDVGKAIIGNDNGLIATLRYHTLNQEYADGIARKFKIDQYFNHKFNSIDINETSRLFNRTISTTARDYLINRELKEYLIEKYWITSWKYESHNYSSLSEYFPFNLDELLFANLKLSKLGCNVDLTKAEMLVIPSFDLQGTLNNIAFRFIDQDIENISAKWLFSHGRQATFGLNLINPDKPVYVVEGLFDHIAMNEMGYQSVGLGSAFISDKHLEYLKGLDLIFLLDSDEVGYKYSQELELKGLKVQYLNNEYKDPYDWWINRGTLKAR